jgi:hypothetical protein
MSKTLEERVALLEKQQLQLLKLQNKIAENFLANAVAHDNITSVLELLSKKLNNHKHI